MLATLLALTETEKQGYIALAEYCIAEPNHLNLIPFFNNLKDYSLEPDYGTTLNYVMEYKDENNIHFILPLNWKAGVEDLEWLLKSSLK